MAYFYGQWKLSGARMLNGNVSCTVPFTAGGQQFTGIVISPTKNVTFVDTNGEYVQPDEEYGNHIIDFGDGTLTTSIDTGFCYAFLNCFSPYSDTANVIGIEPSISIVGNYLTISRRAHADTYRLYVNGGEAAEFLPSEILNSIDLTNYVADDGLESYNITVAALYEDDVYDSDGGAISFESAMSNTVSFVFTSSGGGSIEPDYPEEPEEPVEETAYLMRESTIKGIADAIREKRGTTRQIDAANFATEILAITSSSASDLPTLVNSIAYTSNGDGTCIVSGIGTFTGDDLVIPSVSPFGETVVGIAENAFSGCAGLLSVTIPRSITAIPGGCFNGCTALAELDITDSVVSVGDNAFSGCTSLEAVYYHGDREDYASIDLLEEGNTAFSAATVYYIGTADGLAFSSNGDGTCTVTGIGTCAEKSFAIPSTSPSGDTVVAIGVDAFKDDSTLMHVDFPQGLKKIDAYAFYGCKSLRGIVLPAGIKTLGNYAFKGCVGLKEMVLPDSITSLGTYCFNECSGLVSITLPRSVTTIPKNLIADCTSLTRIVVPKEVKTISQWALSGCTALREIIFEEGSQLTKIETYALSKNPNMPELKLPPLLTTTAGYMLDYNTTLARINYPADLAPSDNTFSGLSKLVRCDIEDIVKFCQKNGSAKTRPTQSATNLVYYNDGEPLINFTLPVEVTLLGSYVFYQCKTLKSVVLHDAVTTIGACCFSGCTGLGAVTLSRSLTSIGSSAFDSCTALKEIELPATLRTVGSSAFKSCTGIKKISTKGTLSDYMKIAFGDANANPLTVAKSLYIGGERLTTLTVPEDCTSIGAYAFYGCADMTSATLGEQVVSIGASGLRACTALREVYLSRNLLSIGNYAFDGCTALTDVYYEGSEEDWALVSVGTNNTLLSGATMHFHHAMGANE